MTVDFEKELEKQNEVIKTLITSFKADLTKLEASTQRNVDRNCQSLADIIDSLKQSCAKGEEASAQLISNLERKIDATKIVLDGDGNFSEGLRLQVQQLSQKERDRTSQLRILSTLGGIVLSASLTIGWTSLNGAIKDNSDTLRSIVKNNSDQDLKIEKSQAETRVRVDGIVREIDVMRDKNKI